MSAKETPRICICLPDDDGGSCIRENCLCPCHSISQPENDCNYADIRKEIEAELRSWHQREAVPVITDLLTKLDKKYGRKP